MKAEKVNRIITPTEYFNISAKKEKTEKEIEDLQTFQDFIKECETYPNHATPAMQDVYSEYQRKLKELANKENNVITEYEERVPNENLEETEDSTRKLLKNKSGYIDATVILVIILNIGFIIAMALLGNK